MDRRRNNVPLADFFFTAKRFHNTAVGRVLAHPRKTRAPTENVPRTDGTNPERVAQRGVARLCNPFRVD